MSEADTAPRQPGTALMPRASVYELEAHRNAAIAAYMEAFDAFARAREALKASAPTGASYHLPEITGANHRHVTWDFSTRDKFLDYVTKGVDQGVWAHLMRATNLDSLMDRQERDAFRAQLDSDPPPATVEYLTDTMRRLVEDSGLIFQRGIATAFAKLDRRFRSHDGFKVGARMVLSYAFDAYGSWNSHSRHEETLLDVERVFAKLAGQPQLERDAGIVGAINIARSQGRALERKAFTAETEFFRVNAFKNGNCHLWFKRPDLVERVNQILADYYGATLGAGADVADVKHANAVGPAKNFGLFESPEAVVSRVLNEARIYTPATYSGRDYPRQRILEPSAGPGALALAAARAGHSVQAVEIQRELAQALMSVAPGLPGAIRVKHADFLTLSPIDLGARFDRIIMNPPFDRGRDVDHVSHALGFLEQGGVLVAVMSASTEFREDRKTVAFRAEVERRGGYFRDLPPQSFAASGTNVNTILCIIGAR